MVTHDRRSSVPRNELAVLMLSAAVLLSAAIGLNDESAQTVNPTNATIPLNQQSQRIVAGIRINKRHYALWNPTEAEHFALRSLSNQVEILQVIDMLNKDRAVLDARRANAGDPGLATASAADSRRGL